MFRQLLTGFVDRMVEQFRGNDAGNAPVLLSLGGFKFSLNTAAFTERRRKTGYRWAAQERIGGHDTLQFTGWEADTIELPGVVYPEFRGVGTTQIGNLRTLANGGIPVRMVTSDGRNFGEWVIEEIEDTQSYFTPTGDFLKQEFTIKLRRYVA